MLSSSFRILAEVTLSNFDTQFIDILLTVKDFRGFLQENWSTKICTQYDNQKHFQGSFLKI